MSNNTLDNFINYKLNNIRLSQIDLHINSISKQSIKDEVIHWFQQSSLHWLLGLIVLKFYITGEDLSKQILVETINDHIVMVGKKTVTTEFRYINDAKEKGYIEVTNSPTDARKKIIKPTKITLHSMNAWFDIINKDFYRLLKSDHFKQNS